MDFGRFPIRYDQNRRCHLEYDVVIDRGKICKRKKKALKEIPREARAHTPVSVEEEVPWKCRRLVIGTGRYGSLPVMDEVKREARRRKIDLLILPTDEAMETLAQKPDDTNAILHAVESAGISRVLPEI